METGTVMQGTLRKTAEFTGSGLHSGRAVRLRVHPAPADHGIRFRRTDLPGSPEILALWTNARPAALCTLLVGEDGAEVATIEHLMAALAGTGIHNALVEVDAAELPILDGSAALYVRRFLAAGIRRMSRPLRALRILRTVTVAEGPAMARLDPCAPGEIAFSIAFDIDFPGTVIGQQSYRLDLANGAFLRELSDCRTFCRLQDVELMRARGLALGGTLDNAVVIDGKQVLTPGGLRRPDEPVRHKMLDALGDLALAGAPILGHYTGIRAGHALTGRLLQALFADPSSHDWVTMSAADAARLPGFGIGESDLPMTA
jgi:UDP-3-O-[3-hydroxymyristoyl] N-acetylglucosamine deacetylase